MKFLTAVALFALVAVAVGTAIVSPYYGGYGYGGYYGGYAPVAYSAGYAAPAVYSSAYASPYYAGYGTGYYGAYGYLKK